MSNKQRNFFQRKKYADKLRDTVTFIEDNNYHRLPIVYGTDDYFLTEDSLWTGYYLPYKDAGFLNLKTRKEYFDGARSFFERFPADKENSGQLLVVNQTQTAGEWEEKLKKSHEERAENEGREIPYGLDYYIELSRKAIDRQEFFSKDVYLFVKLGERANTSSGIMGFLQDFGKLLTSGLGIDESQPEAEEKRGAVEQVDQLHQEASHWWVNPHPLKRSRVEYLVRYLDSLGQPTPDVSPIDRQEWGIGEWQTTMSSFTRNVNLGKGADKKNVHAVEFVTTTGEGKSYAAFLPISYTPKKVAPSANWLFAASTLPFPVDVSLRFEVVAPDRVEKELDKPIQAAKNQEDEEKDSGRSPDEVTMENRMELEAASKHSRTQQKPMVYWQCVFAVYDTDPEELKRKVTQLKATYTTFKFKLESPGGGDQRTLLYQSFPGSDLLVNDWVQRTNAEFVAASMPWLDVHVGFPPENPALYQGYTVITEGGVAKPGSPVFFDLIDLADVVNRAPVEAVIGAPGTGKTVSRGLKPVHENALKGITQFIWDPKGDFTPVKTNAHKLLLDDSKIELVNIGSTKTRDSISLDGFAIAEYDVEEDIDDRQTTAEEVLRGLTKDLNHQNSDINDVIAALVRAVMREAAEQGRNPKMLDVFPILSLWAERKYSGYQQEVDRISFDSYQKASRQLLNRLEVARKHSIARVLFVDPDKGSLVVSPGKTIIFNALKLKEVDAEESPLERFDVAASRVISEMMTSYIRSLVTRLPDKTSKAIALDEWHVIRRSKSAERLKDWLARMGRSKRTTLTTLSQSAHDVDDGSIMNALWVGKAETEDEAVASCQLLGIADDEFNVQTVLNLGKGEFLFRDHERRVARVKIDFWDSDVLALFNTQAATKEG